MVVVIVVVSPAIYFRLSMVYLCHTAGIGSSLPRTIAVENELLIMYTLATTIESHRLIDIKIEDIQKCL